MPAACRKVGDKSTSDWSELFTGAGGNPPWPAHQKGHTDQIFVVKGAFGDQPVLAEIVAVIGTENDERVVGNAQMIQPVQNAPYLAIHEADHAVVDGHVFAQGVRFKQVAVETVIAEGRLLPGGEVRLTLLRFGKVGRHRIEFARFEAARLHRIGIVH